MKVGVVMRRAVVAVAVLFCGSLRCAALGTAFTYQGQLQQSGSTTNDTCDFQFTLFDAALGGAQVGGVQSASPVAVTDGVFTVLLDFGGSAFSGADRWLQIAVRCPTGSGNYATLAPRQAVTAAPYALYAPVAGTANDVSCTGCLSSADLASGAVISAIIGDGQVTTAKLSASGSASGQVLTSNGAGVIWQSPSASNAWSLSGNSGTSASNYLGTNDNTPLELRVNGARALRIEPNAISPNVIAGFSGNAVFPPSAAGATIAGGGASTAENVATAVATVGGGEKNTATGPGSTIGGGVFNTAGGVTATIAGGALNAASADNAAVGGGNENVASAAYATISGGQDNKSSGTGAAVGGGFDNTASADFSVVPGGRSNAATADGSFAAGRFAHAAHSGSFVWGSGIGPATSTGDNQFNVRADGGVFFYIDTGNCIFQHNDSMWKCVSDRNAKENFTEIDKRQVLASVVDMPITRWNFKGGEAAHQHIGPVAQDFHAAFHLNDDDTHIDAGDAQGVALAAVQGLYQLLQEKDAAIANLARQNAALEARLVVLEQAVGKRADAMPVHSASRR